MLLQPEVERGEMERRDQEVEHFQIEKVKVEVHPTREAAGSAAAKAAAGALKKLVAGRESIGVIFATGASQIDTLRALIEIPG